MWFVLLPVFFDKTVCYSCLFVFNTIERSECRFDVLLIQIFLSLSCLSYHSLGWRLASLFFSIWDLFENFSLSAIKIASSTIFQHHIVESYFQIVLLLSDSLIPFTGSSKFTRFRKLHCNLQLHINFILVGNLKVTMKFPYEENFLSAFLSERCFWVLESR